MSAPFPFEHALITGGAGFIGSHLADAFLEAGVRVTVVDDLSTGRAELVPADAELVVADVRSREVAERLAAGDVDLLVHEAAQIDVRRSTADPVADAETNVLGSLCLLEAARRGGVRRVLFASTGGAIYGEQERYPADEEHPTRPLSPYGVAKLAVERYLYYYAAEHHLPAVALRYANVYGERQNPHGEAGVVAIFLDRLLAGELPRSTATACRLATTCTSPTWWPRTSRRPPWHCPVRSRSPCSTSAPGARPRWSSSTASSPRRWAATPRPTTVRPSRVSSGAR